MTDATEPRAFDGRDLGPLAIRPDALGRRYAARVPLVQRDGQWQRYGLVEGVAVVSVDGPLMQRGGWWDGYDSVYETARAAFADPGARAVMLKLSSPGGVAAGAFECSRNLRDLARASGKPLFAYADEQACSAAYALACAAQSICLPPSGEVGSVGVLSAVVSVKRGLEADGIDVRVIRSGALKASGHPFDPLTDDAVAREQADVDALAGQFYALVAEARKMGAPEIEALAGDTRMGRAAVAAGLADNVCTFTEALAAARAAAATTPATGTTTRITTMNENEKLGAAVLALSGAATTEEALGRVTAWKGSHGELTTARAELAAERERSQKAAAASAREAAIAKGLDDRKLTPHEAEQLRAGKGWMASLSTESLSAMIEERAAIAPGRHEVQPPREAPKAGDEVTLTAEERDLGLRAGLTEAELLATKRADLARRG